MMVDHSTTGFDLHRMEDRERKLFEAAWIVFDQFFSKEAGRVRKEKTAVVVSTDFEQGLRDSSSREDIDGYERDGWPLDLNAIAIVSRDVDPRYTILIKKQVFDGDAFLHTIPHELTHVSDFCLFFGVNGNVHAGTDEEKERTGFWPFYHWTEFHAKGVGAGAYAIARYAEVNQEFPKNGRLAFQRVEFHTDDLTRHIEMFEQSRSTGSPDAPGRFWAFMREYMAYLGRLNAFQNPTSADPPDRAFPRELLVRVFGPTIVEAYPLLQEMNRADDPFPLLPSLDGVISAARTYANVRTLWGRALFE